MQFDPVTRARARQQATLMGALSHNVTSDIAVLRLYGAIDDWGGEWGVSAKEFAETLDALSDVKEIRVHINSPGGSVFEAIAIMNQLRAHSARVVAIVDGLAASAASFIAVSADEVVMAPHSELMVHDAWGVSIGNAADMRAFADTLDHLSDNIANIYAAKSGGDAAAWRAVMMSETWISADEAVAAGLADRVDGEDGSFAKAALDLSIFDYAGRNNAPTPTLPTTQSTAEDPITKSRARLLALQANVWSCGIVSNIAEVAND